MSYIRGKGICPNCGRLVGGRHYGISDRNPTVELVRHQNWRSGKRCNGGRKMVPLIRFDPLIEAAALVGEPVHASLRTDASWRKPYTDAELQALDAALRALVEWLAPPVQQPLLRYRLMLADQAKRTVIPAGPGNCGRDPDARLHVARGDPQRREPPGPHRYGAVRTHHVRGTALRQGLARPHCLAGRHPGRRDLPSGRPPRPPYLVGRP